MFTLIDAITAGFLGAIDAGQQALAVFALPILAICALISYYREYSATVMSSGAGLGDALAHALLLIFAAGCYMFVLLQLFDIAQAALNTVFYWGLLGAGSDVTSAQLTAPSFIFEAGMKAANPSPISIPGSVLPLRRCAWWPIPRTSSPTGSSSRALPA